MSPHLEDIQASLETMVLSLNESSALQ